MIQKSTQKGLSPEDYLKSSLEADIQRERINEIQEKIFTFFLFMQVIILLENKVLPPKREDSI